MMIQWHWRQDEDAERQTVLQGKIAATHKMLWNHGVWEAWHLKGEQ